MTFIRKDSDNIDRSYNFVAPINVGGSKKNEVLFPFSDKQTPDYAAVLAVSITQMETFLQPAELTGNATINLTVDSRITKGAKLYIKLDADDQGAKTVTLGTGFDADAADEVVASDTVKFVTYVFDGTAFVAASSESYLAALIAAIDARVTALEGA